MLDFKQLGKSPVFENIYLSMLLVTRENESLIYDKKVSDNSLTTLLKKNKSWKNHLNLTEDFSLKALNEIIDSIGFENIPDILSENAAFFKEYYPAKKNLAKYHFYMFMFDSYDYPFDDEVTKV